MREREERQCCFGKRFVLSQGDWGCRTYLLAKEQMKAWSTYNSTNLKLSGSHQAYWFFTSFIESFKLNLAQYILSKLASLKPMKHRRL